MVRPRKSKSPQLDVFFLMVCLLVVCGAFYAFFVMKAIETPMFVGATLVGVAGLLEGVLSLRRKVRAKASGGTVAKASERTGWATAGFLLGGSCLCFSLL